MDASQEPVVASRVIQLARDRTPARVLVGRAGPAGHPPLPGVCRGPGEPEVLAHAHRSGQVLITLDKDFGEIAIVRRQPHGGIVRLVTMRAEDQGPASVETLARYSADLVQGAIVTVEPGRVRVRARELDGGSSDDK